MEQRDGWMDQQMDRWTDPIPAVSLTRETQSLPDSDLEPPEQNILGMNVSNSRNPFLRCWTATETQSSPSLPDFPCGGMTGRRPLRWEPSPSRELWGAHRSASAGRLLRAALHLTLSAFPGRGE